MATPAELVAEAARLGVEAAAGPGAPQMARRYGRRVHRLPDHRRDGRRAQRTRRAVTPSGGSLTADGPERARRGELDAEDGLAARDRHGLAAGQPGSGYRPC